MKALMFALAILVAVATAAGAAPIASLAGPPVVYVDWQDPQTLPPRLRNHCGFERFTGRPYCSDHCGGNDQIYYCSAASFGCCALGRGYCGYDGLLRCHP